MPALTFLCLLGLALCFVAVLPGWGLLALAGVALMIPLLLAVAISFGDTLSKGIDK